MKKIWLLLICFVSFPIFGQVQHITVGYLTDYAPYVSQKSARTPVGVIPLVFTHIFESSVSIVWISYDSRIKLAADLNNGRLDLTVGASDDTFSEILLFDLTTSLELFYPSSEGSVPDLSVVGVEKYAPIISELEKIRPFLSFSIREYGSRDDMIADLMLGDVDAVAVDYLEERYEIVSLENSTVLSNWLIPNYPFYINYKDSEFDFLKSIIENRQDLGVVFDLVPEIRDLNRQSAIDVEVDNVLLAGLINLVIGLFAFYLLEERLFNKKSATFFFLFLFSVLGLAAFYFTPLSQQLPLIEYLIFVGVFVSLFPVVTKFQVNYPRQQLPMTLFFILGSAISAVAFFLTESVTWPVTFLLLGFLSALCYLWLLVLPLSRVRIRSEYLVGLTIVAAYIIYFLVGIHTGFVLGPIATTVGFCGFGLLFFARTGLETEKTSG